MIKFNEIKIGDYVLAENDGDRQMGEVTGLKKSTHQVCVDAGVQDFWYDFRQISSIPLNEKALLNLKFKKQINEDGTVKYMKGAFRLLIPKEGDFSKMELWYRDEHRHIINPIDVHVLQNHFRSMTKVYLDDRSFD